MRTGTRAPHARWQAVRHEIAIDVGMFKTNRVA